MNRRSGLRFRPDKNKLELTSKIVGNDLSLGNAASRGIPQKATLILKHCNSLFELIVSVRFLQFNITAC